MADSCAHAIPLSVSRWPSKVNSPDPWTSCSERDDTEDFARSGGVGQAAGHNDRMPEVVVTLVHGVAGVHPDVDRDALAFVGGDVGADGTLDVDGAAQGACDAAEGHHEPVALTLISRPPWRATASRTMRWCSLRTVRER